MSCINALMSVMPWMVVMVLTTSLLEPVEPLGLDAPTGLDAVKTPCSLIMSLREWLTSSVSSFCFSRLCTSNSNTLTN